MKKDTAIVLTATSDLAFSIANVIIGLHRHSPALASDVIIYHDGFSKTDMALLKKLGQNIRFKKYTFEIFQKKTSLTEKECDEWNSLKKYSHISFARYEIFDLLKEYHTVIYLDADILIQDDISSLKHYGPLACLMDVEPAFHQFAPDALRTLLDSDFPQIPFDENLLAYNSGVIVVHDTLKGHGSFTAKLYNLTTRYFMHTLSPDQCILNLFILTEGLLISPLPRRLNHMVVFPHYASSAIIHFVGSRKIWSHAVIHTLFPEWEKNNALWKKLGGSQFTGVIRFRDYCPEGRVRLVTQMENMAFWEPLYSAFIQHIPLLLRPSAFLTLRYFQLFLPGINKNIHYELAKGAPVTVALHCELTSHRELFRTFLHSLPTQIDGLHFEFKESSGNYIFQTSCAPTAKAIATALTTLTLHTYPQIYAIFGKIPPEATIPNQKTKQRTSIVIKPPQSPHPEDSTSLSSSSTCPLQSS